MNLIRAALIILIALNAYFLLIFWQKDYPKLKEVTVDLEKPLLSKKETDLPQIEKISPTPIIPDISYENRYVTVKTDVLIVKIDLVGGDIIYSALLKYPTHIENKNDPFVLLSKDPYEYVIQSGFLGASGKDLDSGGSNFGRPLYKTNASTFEIKDDFIEIPLSYEIKPGLTYTKTFKLKRNSYLVDEVISIKNNNDVSWTGKYFSQIKRNQLEDPSIGKKSVFGLSTYLGFAYWKPDDPFNKVSFSDIEDAQNNNEPLKFSHAGGWVSFVQHYFISALIPDATQSFDYFARKNTDGEYIFGYTAKDFLNIEAFSTKNLTNQFYIGPKIQSELKKAAKGLDLSVDYGVLYFIAKKLFLLLEWFYSQVHNWGWAIVLLTVLVKAIFYYPSAISYKSMARMKKIQPQIAKLKELYKNDHQKVSQEMMKIYQKEKVNPLGGCLPVLLQMPVFLALYWTLLESVELRHAEFIFWVHDLSIMDPYFVLPILMGASMFLQTALSATSIADPMQEKVMKFMPVFFTVFFLFMPAGLVLYWLTNNILSILQQWFITRQVAKAE